MNKINYILCLFVISSQLAFAGSLETGNPVRERTSKDGMTEGVYKTFEKLQEMVADGKLVEARAGLSALAEKKRLNNYERASVHQFLGFVDSGEDKFVAAGKNFQVAIDMDSLHNVAHFGVMMQKAQIVAASGDYEKAIRALKAYYAVTDKITDATFYFEAGVYAQMEKYKLAITALKKSIKLSSKPIEVRHYLLFNLHMQLSEFRQAASALEVLIAINPNKRDYWIKLSEVYFTLQKDEKSLAALVVADKNGLLTEEKDRLKIFKMYAFLGSPYKAGEVLEKGLRSGVIKPNYKRWDDLGSVWYTAAEMDRSLSAYDEASKLATDGKIDFRRAYIYFGRDDWNGAKNALLSALEKGGLKEKKIGTANLLLGMAYSELNQSAQALNYLNAALKFKNTKKNAIQWINHIEREAKQSRKRAEAEKAIADEKAANQIDQ